ncbi:GNAT family N-acetyltransferase [Ectobacillus antri]|jgi:ribosomal protein S18 acetylase RimI-like enzyme|uniref:GNAT family N-acetyltransferase n=1 Tax=Ectobacillus antri TaxID=2486280 RepID=UPI000F58FE4C|nr:GNAT family N-acetyltransferase [Ectobacillus antri]
MNCIIRTAQEMDAAALAAVRLQIDGETENMDREPGEAYIDEAGFRRIIREDNESPVHVFLVAEVDGCIAGFARCVGSTLKRLSHQVDFGIGVLRQYWGNGIGKQLLQGCIAWADANEIEKIKLAVLETNTPAIELYKTYGFEVEGILRNDKRLSDGNYYNTVLMGRLRK